MKRVIAAVLVLLALVCMVTVSASTPGTQTNPLISRSYLEGAYAATLMDEIESALGGAADRAINRLNEAFGIREGFSFAPRFTPISLVEGGTVALSSGSSFILLSGSASIDVAGGVVINVSTGSVVSAGSQLVQHQRYFCTEHTAAVITASSAATGQVDGYYLLDGGSAPVGPLPFTDVSRSDWFFEAVEFVFNNQLFRGTSTTAFSPGASMTRGMFVTVLHRLDGLPAAGGDVRFSDVTDPSQFYYDAVVWANENGIVTGYTDGTFRPDLSVTREQMAAIMHRYADFKDKDMSAPGAAFDAFPDSVTVSEYAADAMRWAVSREVIRGSDGRLLPQNTATRAQVAQIIFNYCERIGR